MFLGIGITSIIAGILSFLFAALNRHGYYNMLDGEGDKYTGMYRRMLVFGIIGIILAVIGIACIIIYAKSHI